MTPADEARFIEFWTQGIETAQIARQLGPKITTAQSRAYRLQHRGLIQPRPRGGAYPSQRALARQNGAPATPATPIPPATHSAPAPPAMTFVAVPEIQEMLKIMKD